MMQAPATKTRPTAQAVPKTRIVSIGVPRFWKKAGAALPGSERQRKREECQHKGTLRPALFASQAKLHGAQYREDWELVGSAGQKAANDAGNLLLALARKPFDAFVNVPNGVLSEWIAHNDIGRRA